MSLNLNCNFYLHIHPTILLNDVSQINYYLIDDIIIDNSGNWELNLYIEIFDHFGLDDEDPNNKVIGVLPYQCLHCGFAAWWVLQHLRAYVPFITKIKFIAKIRGNCN